MVRSILAVIVGFIVMMAGVMAVFGIAMLALGGDGTYKPGTYWTTDKFNVIVLIGGTLASALGGLVCGLIGRSRKALIAFAALLLAFGALDGVRNARRPDPPPAIGTPTFDQIREHGKEPLWFNISKTLLGAVGVLLGGWSFAKPRKAA